MEKAIEVLTVMLNKLKKDATKKYMGDEYYICVDAKIDAIEDAIELLKRVS